MGPLCDQWGCWGPPAAIVGVGKAQTHSPTVWGWFMSAQTLWPVGDSQECLPGGHFGQTGWSGETGGVQDGLGSPRQRGPADVASGKHHSGRGVAGGLSGQSAHLPELAEEGEAAMGTPLRVTYYPVVPGVWDFQGKNQESPVVGLGKDSD